MVVLRCFGLVARPSGEFAPAGDLLFERPKSRQKDAPAPSPLRFAPGSLAMLAAQGSRRTHFATLRSNSCAKSVDEARFARALGCCASQLLQRGVTEQPNSQQPIAKPARRSQRGISLPPFSTAEQRKTLRPRVQHASRTDSAQVFERSVAKRVLRGASRSEQRRAPEAKRRAVRSGVVSLPTFLSTQESRSPAGANSRHGPSH